MLLSDFFTWTPFLKRKGPKELCFKENILLQINFKKDFHVKMYLFIAKACVRVSLPIFYLCFIIWGVRRYSFKCDHSPPPPTHKGYIQKLKIVHFQFGLWKFQLDFSKGHLLMGFLGPTSWPIKQINILNIHFANFYYNVNINWHPV